MALATVLGPFGTFGGFELRPDFDQGELYEPFSQLLRIQSEEPNLFVNFIIFNVMKVMLGAIPLVINDETMKAFMKQNQDNEHRSPVRKQVDHTAGFFENY